MSQLGVRPQAIIDVLQSKGVAAEAGRVPVGAEYLAVHPTGGLSSVEQIQNVLISSGGSGSQIFLRDVANVRRGYEEPPRTILRYDGKPAIGIGISTVSGGNVVRMGEALEKRAQELLGQVPLGMEVGRISVQSEAVTTAISGFLVNLVEAVAIVVVVLLLFMGLRSGLLIGFVLALTICGTFIFMAPWHVALERISLGALVIALGMLVDNAIVVVDGVLVRTQQGQGAAEAAEEVVAQTSMPLLGATAVAIMAFGAIGLSDDSTGEFCRSLFQVVLISLGLSWLTAVTVTPVLCAMFLPSRSVSAGREGPSASQDAFDGRLYRLYRSFLEHCLRLRWLTMGVVVALFAASLWGFGYVDKSFFPASTRPQFMLDFWLPQGTYIEATEQAAKGVEKYLLSQEHVTHVTSLVGAGGMRFLLTYQPEKPNGAYAQFLVDVDDYHVIDGLIDKVEADLGARYADALVYGRSLALGPGEAGKIQARFNGPDANVLRHLAAEAEAIFHEEPEAKAIRTNWRQRVKVITPVVAEEEANAAGVTRQDVATSIRVGFEGVGVSVYRERDELLPLVLRAPESERLDVAMLGDLQIWSPVAQKMIPLRQVVSTFATHFEDDIIERLNRKRSIIVYADPKHGPAPPVLARVMPKVEAIPRPPGYELEWWGEYRDSAKAQGGIAASLPFFLLGMVLIVIVLFNGLRQPAVIWLCVPLALIGVVGGLLATHQPFGFMSLLGALSLSGMLIKNAIVLVDEIELQKRSDFSPYEAILRSGVSRLRPVAMAALTTALGMLPLLTDAFFLAMAVTIVAGLVVATILTMIVVPVLYALFFRISSP